MAEYLRVGEVAELLGVSPETIRAYGRKGILEPDKVSESGFRYYSREHVNEFVGSVNREEYLGIGEVVKLTRFSDSKIERLISEGKLMEQPKGINGRRRFLFDDVVVVMENEPVSSRDAVKILGITQDELNILCESGVLKPIGYDSRNRRLFKRSDIYAVRSKEDVK